MCVASRTHLRVGHKWPVSYSLRQTLRSTRNSDWMLSSTWNRLDIFAFWKVTICITLIIVLQQVCIYVSLLSTTIILLHVTSWNKSHFITIPILPVLPHWSMIKSFFRIRPNFHWFSKFLELYFCYFLAVTSHSRFCAFWLFFILPSSNK